LPSISAWAKTGVGCRFFDEDGNFVGSDVKRNIAAGPQAALFLSPPFCRKTRWNRFFSWLELGRTLSETRAAAATISTHLSCTAAIGSSR
jgi:hypothetical protein